MPIDGTSQQIPLVEAEQMLLCNNRKIGKRLFQTRRILHNNFEYRSFGKPIEILIGNPASCGMEPLTMVGKKELKIKCWSDNLLAAITFLYEVN